MATREDVISKIQKLLKLAESSNINEASTAAALAQDLMSRYEIEAASLEAETTKVEAQEPVETFSDYDSGGRLANWRGCLLNAIAVANGCGCFKTRTKFGSATELKVVGRKTDAQTVRYLYKAMTSLVDSLATVVKGEGRAFIASFKSGAASAIAQRIREAKAAAKMNAYKDAAQTGGNALMRVDNAVAVMAEREKALKAVMDTLGLKGGAKTRVSHGEAYMMGRQAGMNANLGSSSRPLSSGAAQISF